MSLSLFPIDGTKNFYKDTSLELGQKILNYLFSTIPTYNWLPKVLFFEIN